MEKNNINEFKNKSIKRLTVKIDATRHKEIKMRSIYRGMTMAEWVTVAIDQRLIEEDKYNKG